MKRLLALVAVSMVGLGLAVPAVRAQDEERKDAPDSLQKRQKALAEAYRQFQEKLSESANAFSRTEPEKALRLRRAVDASRQAFTDASGNVQIEISKRMEEIADLLDSRKSQDAMVIQKEVLDALDRVLELLESDDPRKDGERQDPKRLAEIREELQKILKEQKEHRRELAKARDLEQKARALVEAGKKLAELYDAQKALADRTTDATPEERGPLAAKQRELEAQAGELGKLLELVDQLPGGESADEKPGDEKPGQPADGSKAGPAGSAARSVAAAKGAMGEAQKKLDAAEAPQALERQRKALEDLDAARKALDRKKMQVERLAQIERKKAELEKLREATDKLGKRMGEQPPQGGAQPGAPKAGGQKGGQGGKKGQPQAPGKRHVEKAEEEQRRAGDDLENRHVKDAEDKEDEAIKQLEEADEALREALIQARKREQEETLKALGARFQQMLEKQRELTKRTEALDKERAPIADAKPGEPDKELTRKQRIEVTAICKGANSDRGHDWGEVDLRDQADQAVELTKEEGSTTILPTVLLELREDLGRVVELLDKRDTGRFVQSVQRDVERTLEELIEVIKKEIEERKSGGGGGGGGGGDDKNGDPLVPASAELKMIRAQQVRVNGKTREFDVVRPAPEQELSNDQREACRLIGEKQGRVAELTRRLHTKLNKED